MTSSRQRCSTCGLSVSLPRRSGTIYVCPVCQGRPSSAEPLHITLDVAGARSGSGGPPPSEVVLDPEFLARYEVGKLLGRGSMGLVLEATDRVSKRRVAIKLMVQLEDDTAVRRFLKEGRILETIDHPNVVRVFEVGNLGKNPYLVAECLDGGTLRDLLHRRASLPVQEAVLIVVQCLAGLHACHQLGAVHRDFKPENVLFGKGTPAKVADLGVAKTYGSGDETTATGIILGTPRYMSPEQARGEKVGIGSDLYSVGLVLHEMLSGRRVFAGDNVFQLMSAQMEKQAPPIRSLVPDVPEALERELQKVLSKKIEERHATADELSTALQRAAGISSRTDVVMRLLKERRPHKTDTARAGDAQADAAMLERTPAPAAGGPGRPAEPPVVRTVAGRDWRPVVVVVGALILALVALRLLGG